MEVSPTAHFHMGGIAIDAECRTSLEGLFAAGEDAAGVHGANRLGGNGVAESIVFGARAGGVLAACAAGRALPALDEDWAHQAATAALAPLMRAQGEDAFALRERLGQLTWDQVGLVRHGAGLQSALDELESLAQRATEIAVNPSRRLNGEWQQALDVGNLIQVARLIARAAQVREESRGSHYRSDFPQADDSRWLRNVRLQNAAPAPLGGAPGGIEVEVRPAVLTRLQPAVAVP